MVLLLASLLFFATLFVRLRALVSDSLFDQLDQIYSSYATLLESRLLRLSSLFGFSRRLLSLLAVLARFQLLLFLLFRPTSHPALPSPLAAIRREGVAAITLCEQQRVARVRSLVERGFPLFKQSIEEDFRLRALVSRSAGSAGR